MGDVKLLHMHVPLSSRIRCRGGHLRCGHRFLSGKPPSSEQTTMLIWVKAITCLVTEMTSSASDFRVFSVEPNVAPLDGAGRFWAWPTEDLDH